MCSEGKIESLGKNGPICRVIGILTFHRPTVTDLSHIMINQLLMSRGITWKGSPQLRARG